MSSAAAIRKWSPGLMATFLAVPLLNLGYQFGAEQLAHVTAGIPFGPDWLVGIMRQPWMAAIIVIEIGSFIAWMSVLASLSVSEAFPLTAVGYLLVIALGWIWLREPIRPLQIVGAVSIALGVFFVGSGGVARDANSAGYG